MRCICSRWVLDIKRKKGLAKRPKRLYSTHGTSKNLSTPFQSHTPMHTRTNSNRISCHKEFLPAFASCYENSYSKLIFDIWYQAGKRLVHLLGSKRNPLCSHRGWRQGLNICIVWTDLRSFLARTWVILEYLKHSNGYLSPWPLKPKFSVTGRERKGNKIRNWWISSGKGFYC